MSRTVYLFPPVGVVAQEWTRSDPVQDSRGALSGRSYLSSFGRPRKLARLSVSSLALGAMGAGHMQSLIRLLAGGVHAVRLYSRPVDWWVRHNLQRYDRGAYPMEWRGPSHVPLEWRQAVSGDLVWYQGAALVAHAPGVDDAGFDTLTITGLPPLTLVARPAEWVEVFATMDATSGSRAQVVAPAWSDHSGTAVIRLFDPLPAGPRVNLGAADTAVFEVDGEMPRAMQPLRGDWTWDWSFREIFADETPGGFVEVDPWTVAPR